MFLAWHDADPAKPAARKASETVRRFMDKYGAFPTILLIGPETVLDPSEFPGFEIRTVDDIPANTFYVGIEEATHDPE